MSEPVLDKKLSSSIDTGSIDGKGVATFRSVTVWFVAGNLARLASIVVIAGLGSTFANFGSLENAPSYTAEQWNSVVQSKSTWAELAWGFMILASVLLANKAVRSRKFLSTLPQVPTLHSSKNPAATAIPLPWPPVPEGRPSWMRRVPYRATVSVAMVWYVGWIGAIQFDANVSPSSTKYVVLITLCVLSVLSGLLCIVVDALRLRGWARWPKLADTQ